MHAPPTCYDICRFEWKSLANTLIDQVIMGMISRFQTRAKFRFELKSSKTSAIGTGSSEQSIAGILDSEHLSQFASSPSLERFEKWVIAFVVCLVWLNRGWSTIGWDSVRSQLSVPVANHDFECNSECEILEGLHIFPIHAQCKPLTIIERNYSKVSRAITWRLG